MIALGAAGFLHFFNLIFQQLLLLLRLNTGMCASGALAFNHWPPAYVVEAS